MTTTTTDKRDFSLREVGAFVDTRVEELQKGYLKDKSEAVGILARLRRGAGKPIEDVPELWGLALDADLYSIPAKRKGESEEHREKRTRAAEFAAHTALTLYATHQQSHRTERMHRAGYDLGGAVRRLMPTTEIDEPLRRRFVEVGTATNLRSLAERLREIVTLLRRDAVPLDYGRLADQLYLVAQEFYGVPSQRQDGRKEGMKEVRLSWGRGFQAYRPKAAGGTGTEENPQAGAEPAQESAPDTDTTTTDKDDS
ncbi:type I-E CRISPR-associated protein Cse2/CasB [Salinactinospora qingdaonensis]|uniref:CRISPR system Cascade subunit CasB n=1 Tax=Salinactinospora qingdaonensis TaxID=702744 RepID=A0ABP7FYK9_9ACTN